MLSVRAADRDRQTRSDYHQEKEPNAGMLDLIVRKSRILEVSQRLTLVDSLVSHADELTLCLEALGVLKDFAIVD